MLEAILGAHPAVQVALIAVGVVAAPKFAGGLDTILGQPRDGGKFGKNRETKVKEFYIVAGIVFLIAAIASVTL